MTKDFARALLVSAKESRIQHAKENFNMMLPSLCCGLLCLDPRSKTWTLIGLGLTLVNLANMARLYLKLREARAMKVDL